MYVGRIVMIGRSGESSFVAYRVSSRSFPNRRAEIRNSAVLVSPINPSDLALNPYISYNCIRTWEDVAVVSNGTHTDMIMERIQDGSRPLDAVALSLVAFGYERDELSTPRIAGVVRRGEGILGIVLKDELRVKSFSLQDGDAYFVATYEQTGFDHIDMMGNDPGTIARAAFGLPYERPVCSAAAFKADTKYDLAVYNPV